MAKSWVNRDCRVAALLAMGGGFLICDYCFFTAQLSFIAKK
jgi:hypothetical protein